MKTTFIEVCTTDGNALLKLEDITSIVEDPTPNGATCMVTMMGGQSFEVSKTLKEFRDFIKKVGEAV